jgi:hypothetical protein
MKRKALSCETCEHLKPCSNEYGGLDETENCSAVIGTHLCLASWREYGRCPENNEIANLVHETKSIDGWQCPYCNHWQQWGGNLAQACPIGELSGFSEELTCSICNKVSLVSMSIEYTAQRIVR